MKQKDNFVTDLHTYYVFTQEEPSHPPSLCLRAGAAPHHHLPLKSALALRPDGWMHFAYLKVLWREICPLHGGKGKGYNALVQYSCTDSIHSLKCKWLLSWYKKSTGYNSGHLKSTLEIFPWVPSISQSNLMFLKPLGKERSILLTLDGRSNFGRPTKLILTGLSSSVISWDIKWPQTFKLVCISNTNRVPPATQHRLASRLSPDSEGPHLLNHWCFLWGHLSKYWLFNSYGLEISQLTVNIEYTPIDLAERH